MAREWKVYEPAALVESIMEDPRPKSVRRLLQRYLRKGAPYFLEQCVQIGTATLPQDVRRAVRQLASELLQREYSRWPTLPERGEDGLFGGLSRVYEQGWKPRELPDEGMLHAAVLETCAEMQRGLLSNPRAFQAEWRRSQNRIVELVLAHPQCNVAAVNTLFYVLDLVGREVYPASSGSVVLHWVKNVSERNPAAIQAYFENRVASFGMRRVLLEVLDAWADRATYRFWSLLTECFNEGLRSSREQIPATQTLEVLLEQAEAQEDTLVRHAARNVLRCYPLDEASNASRDENIRIFVQGFLMAMVRHLKDDLPSLRTRHGVIRWLKYSTRTMQERFALLLAYDYDRKAGVDPRSEILVEEIWPEAWPYICAMEGADPARGIDTELMLGLALKGGKKERSPEYQQFRQALDKSHLRRHNPSVAEPLEWLVHGSGVSAEEANASFQGSMDLLSGDILQVTTHLHTSWMPLQRRQDEFLGGTFSQVYVSRHPNARVEERGAACRFRVPLPEDSWLMVEGDMDPEGELTLRNTPILDAQSRLVLKALVADAVRAVLVPHVVDKPSREKSGPSPLYFTDEMEASRPLIHTVAYVRQNGERDYIEPATPRISPALAKSVFEWLLGVNTDWAFLLHRFHGDRLRLTPGVEEGIRAGIVPLGEVYLRTVRAHTRPLSARLDDNGQVVMQQMSDNARANYVYYRQNGGRELSFEPVEKTYIFPDGRRRVLRVPRTFVQGAFASLEQILGVLAFRYPELHQQASRAFRVE